MDITEHIGQQAVKAASSPTPYGVMELGEPCDQAGLHILQGTWVAWDVSLYLTHR